MRKLVISALLSLGLSLCLNTPAHAVFGLSACEKVKASVLDLENDLNKRLDYLRPYEGKVLSGWPQAEYNQASTLDFPNKLWKIGYNNPKCFTNTQKLLIKKLPTMGMEQVVWANAEHTFYKTGKCKDPLTRLLSPECIKSSIYTLQYAKSWPSLYTY